MKPLQIKARLLMISTDCYIIFKDSRDVISLIGKRVSWWVDETRGTERSLTSRAHQSNCALMIYLLEYMFFSKLAIEIHLQLLISYHLNRFHYGFKKHPAAIYITNPLTALLPALKRYLVVALFFTHIARGQQFGQEGVLRTAKDDIL